jgi:serine/threonine protein kinase
LALTPGTRLGVYEVAAQIGEGGMGQVFRATDTRLKRQVAIKILPPSLGSDASTSPPLTMVTNWNAAVKK